jgi:hypothetical protein
LNGEPPEYQANYYKISRGKWAEVESAHDARARLKSLILKKNLESGFPDNSSIQVRVGTRPGRNTGKEVVVEIQHPEGEDEVPTPAQLREILPSKMDGVAGRGTESKQVVKGIPIRIKDSVVTPTLYYDDDYVSVYGGAKYAYKDKSDGNNYRCTTATRAYSEDYSEYIMLTAGHCAGNTSFYYQPDYWGFKPELLDLST